MVDEKMGSKEESSFSRTWRFLSQYLKENGSLGGLAPLDQGPQGKSRAPTTMSLFPGVDVSGEVQTQINQDKTSQKSMDLFPQESTEKERVKALETKQKETHQLTIFYAGKVLVFNNYPAHKARDLMGMASKASVVSAGAECTSSPEPKLSTAAAPPPDSLPKPNSSDMPIARRHSLHRFLEKRKDRIHSKAPYQGNSSSSMKEAKPESSQPWLNLGREISHPDHSSNNSK
ncbi:protein TIFY 10a-like [Curcuma longa]|uniref:protein TIFY 10a-like n=1 Tax=Curcuma longa TaxID=136217 RepID=UPI003D9FA85B